MKKIDAIHYIAEGNHTKAAKELGITRQTLWKWPNTLNRQQIDLVNGVLFRLANEQYFINLKASK